MRDNSPSDDSQVRFKELANDYQPKLPRKLALLLPFKSQIEKLLERKASYDDIRLLLEDVKITVSKDSVHRFCHQVIGQKVVRQRNVCAKEITPLKIPSVQQSPPESVQASLQQQRKLIPGPWSRRKPGPRITAGNRHDARPQPFGSDFASLDSRKQAELVKPQTEHLLAVLRTGNVSTNAFLRKIHNFAVDMNWLPATVIPRRLFVTQRRNQVLRREQEDWQCQ